MLMFSMGVSLDGFIADSEGSIDWAGVPSDELFDFHLARVRELGGILLGRRLYEAMRVWETDPSLRDGAARVEFADVWTALPKVVFSRSLTGVEGNARLAQESLADEIAAVLRATDRDVEIGGADLAGQAMSLGLVDEMRLFRYPVVLGGGTPAFPEMAESVALGLVETRVFNDRVLYERYRTRPA